jgi:hypothetical protein
MTTRDAFGLAASPLTLAACLPYLLSTLKKGLRPHAFSWILWGAASSVAFAAQYGGNAGPGAWMTGLTALPCFAIAAAALRNGCG